MSTIIRATERNGGTHAVAFNFEDMASQAEKYLERVRADAAGLIAKAQRDAEAIRKRAEVEGQQLARQAAAQAMEQALAAKLATALPAVQRVIQDIQHAKQSWLAHWESSAVSVAAAIAARVIRRELSGKPEIPLTLVREALELAAGSSHLRIRLNPADLETIRPQVEMLVKELSPLAAAEIAADPTITAGGCRVETRFGTIDQQFEAQLKRIEEELAG